MILSLNPNSGVPVYLQLMEQIKHAIGTGILRPGDQLPGLRKLAESLVINPNTVARAYRELEHEGVIELRQGSGAFVRQRAAGSTTTQLMKKGERMVKDLVRTLLEAGLSEEEIRRLVEATLLELCGASKSGERRRQTHAGRTGG
ncbi:MAG: GntR family transcriptional regulator [Bryobacteraceae bacterium]|nr:GntR family transcriptional regulator [Bryobacteraceae bacterium]MDW8377411.1 GntR family transcriptional regulator [Bryobacterales bacterium]